MEFEVGDAFLEDGTLPLGQVLEAAMAPELLNLLNQQVAAQGFRLAPQFLELKGTCSRCQREN